MTDPDSRRTARSPELFERWRTRMSDLRFYKGCLEADVVELLAQRNIAEVFAKLEGSPRAEEIHVTVQALSGGPANNAIYEAFIKPGETVMGLSLSHGGHLSHGSPFNISGRRYNVISYEIDPQTRRLDYDTIVELARRHKPKLIIGGSSAYPWDIEWSRLREAADACGALLLADIAHLSGMVSAGVLNNPLPHADIVSFTTHKTLCGPRGAVILTKRRHAARMIETAVFPGLQGGPHVHSIAGIARLFEIILADPEEWRSFQQRIVDNTAYLAQCLTEAGFQLEYGGTDTHLLLVDLKSFKTNGDEGTPIDGEIAARLLEIAGIVLNKNVIAGDAHAGEASGIRMGMPWATQRGITRPQIKRLAGVIHDVLSQVHTTRVWVRVHRQRCRGRIDPQALWDARATMDEIAQELPFPPPPEDRIDRLEPRLEEGLRVLRIWGPYVDSSLQQTTSCNLAGLNAGETRPGLVLSHTGDVISPAFAMKLDGADPFGQWALAVPADRAEETKRWIESLSDGYTLLDAGDLYAKVDGPMAVRDDTANLVEQFNESDLPSASTGEASNDLVDNTKPFFVGQKAIYADNPPPSKNRYVYEPGDLPVRKTVLNETHRKLEGRMVEFGGWDMPVYYPTGIFAEQRAVRTAAGLFDVSHMSVFEIGGAGARAFCQTTLANDVAKLTPGVAQYTFLLYPDGTAMDDAFLYCFSDERFVIVVNAANAERDWDWFEAVNSREFIIDQNMPGKQIEADVTLRNLRDAGPDSRLDLALQGPASETVLQRLTNRSGAAAIAECGNNRFVEVELDGVSAIVARTGYTGERIGFELFVHPDRTVALWEAILNAGRSEGVMPAGLGARDAARTEAGFPLFGHELEGEERGAMTEADYGFVARLHVPFFIGRDEYIKRVTPRRRKIARLRGKGRRSLRAGHLILDGDSRPVGVVTSFAYLDEELRFVVLAYVDEDFDMEPGQSIKGARLQEIESGESVPEGKLVDLEAVSRFPGNKERSDWQSIYRSSE
jgi:glycine hydroxymethyltransferase